MSENKCEIENCNSKATHLTATETKIIEICADHWNEIYRK